MQTKIPKIFFKNIFTNTFGVIAFRVPKIKKTKGREINRYKSTFLDCDVFYEYLSDGHLYLLSVLP